MKIISDPDCIKAGEGSKLGKELGDAFLAMIDAADCTTTSGGPGSLNFKMVCVAQDGRHMTLGSAGSYTNDNVSWTINFAAENAGSEDVRSMEISAHKLRNTC